MGTVDVYRITSQIDDSTLDVMVARLEARGKHSRFAAMMQNAHRPPCFQVDVPTDCLSGPANVSASGTVSSSQATLVMRRQPRYSWRRGLQPLPDKLAA
jgi:hypothetical protein